MAWTPKVCPEQCVWRVPGRPPGDAAGSAPVQRVATGLMSLECGPV
ncbi:hypothetical protein [Bosea lathyri]|nr:hypothetical protein [Bosea lathyri]